jgi:chemotaxis protein MotA
MLSLVGALIVTISVFGGYLLEGGHPAVLFQPIELLIIGGAGVGSLVISSPPSLLKAMVQQILGVLKGHTPGKSDYMDLLGLLFELVKQAKANPLSIEAHVDNPENSDIFKKFPGVLHNHHAVQFLCDTLKVQLSGSMSPYDLEDLMDQDIAVAHEEEHKIPSTITKIGDAMPGLGIVAAVLGVVITMGKLSMGKEVIGHSVAAALVGTFLGILLSYGFLQPLAGRIENNLGAEGRYILVIKACLLAYSKNCGPKVCVEFARRNVPPEVRPTFTELDQATSSSGGAAKAA